MVTQIAFFALVAFVAFLRLSEVLKSNSHERKLLQMGGREHAPRHYIVMVAMHTLWFVSMVAEVYFLDRPFYLWLFILALVFTSLGMTLRYLSMQALGVRWTVRIFTLPGTEPVTLGIYRYVRHPIYLGVILELAAIPLLHTALLTSIVFSIANGFLLRVRIREEEKALRKDNHYDTAFGDKGRMLPL